MRTHTGFCEIPLELSIVLCGRGRRTASYGGVGGARTTYEAYGFHVYAVYSQPLFTNKESNMQSEL